MTYRSTAARLALAATVAVPTTALGQARVEWRTAPTQAIGSDAEDRARLAQLLGRDSLDGFLLRSPSSSSVLAAPLPAPGVDSTVAAIWWPQIATVYNSALPFSLNDGPLWAGRGTSVSITGGVRLRHRAVYFTFAPTYVYAGNRDFPRPTDPRIAPPLPPTRDPFSYPWRVYGASIDYPLRFGPDSYQRLDLGETSLYTSHGGAEFGFTNESEWWGPGVRNALVLSNNAPGIPRLFARTARPVRTRVGTLEGRYVLGALSTSPFFETDAYPKRGRSFNALAITLRPAVVPTLTVGLARAVYAQTTDNFGSVATHVFDVVSVIGRPNARPSTDLSQHAGRDQIYSLFARWVLPESGFESYAEWGRTELPRSVRDFLVSPNHTQGYTVGLQYAAPIRASGVTGRLQAEASNVAQSSTYAQRPTGSWYTSRAAVQGYTQRGQVIGAAIGPGGSSQWLAVDAFGASWTAGLFAGRVRWDDDAHYSAQLPNGGFCRHDVSLLGGIRGTGRLAVGSVSASVTAANRLNTFYQNTGVCLNDAGARVDTPNTTLALTFTPRGGW